jgi:hypothetical protein
MLLAVLRPEQIECAGNGAVQQITDLLRLWPVMGQNPVKQDDLRGHLRQFGTLVVVETLGRSDE